MSNFQLTLRTVKFSANLIIIFSVPFSACRVSVPGQLFDLVIFIELDVVGCAHAYGLLRMPRMKEFRNRDLSLFKRVDINTASVPFKNKKQEQRRQENMLKLHTETTPVSLMKCFNICHLVFSEIHVVFKMIDSIEDEN